MKEITVGWCLAFDQYKIAFDQPRKLIPLKDQSENQKGYLSCPAVRSFSEGQFIVTSPYSIKLRAIAKNNNLEIFPVYPFTSINDTLVKSLIQVEHSSTWRKSNLVTIQIPSPYVFFSDDLIFMEQAHPLLTDQTSLNWRVIPGIIDIYSWQRPMNWSFEWDVNAGDLIINSGEPIYSLRFFSEFKNQIQIKLKEYKINKKIEEQLALTRSIATVKKGIKPFFQKAKLKRKKIKLL